jgi:hypothetical protein
VHTTVSKKLVNREGITIVKGPLKSKPSSGYVSDFETNVDEPGSEILASNVLRVALPEHDQN